MNGQPYRPTSEPASAKGDQRVMAQVAEEEVQVAGLNFPTTKANDSSTVYARDHAGRDHSSVVAAIHHAGRSQEEAVGGRRGGRGRE